MTSAYIRRVSSEEARLGRILVEKAKLTFFPPEGELFDLRGFGRAKVDSYACVCRAPEKPHRHWFIQLEGLTRGATVTIRNERGRYALESSPS